MKLITLKFLSPFKIGEKENYVDSITLYRAFIKALTLLGYSFEEIRKGDVKFSSTFPVVSNRPYLKIPFRRVECNERTMDKELRKIEYIDVDILRSVEPPYLLQCQGERRYLVGNGVERLELENKYLTSHGGIIVEYKNRIDRLVNSADIYTSPSFMPKHDLGFFCYHVGQRIRQGLKALGETWYREG
ncbi:hypothetical protein [Metallosphaera hakonensis]|uniref:hypothetical protein n=1 Tax=Metallosphaera hakonensis TaxID=79601 RepID=UPI000ABD8143|nr:hypothetical protein [Metallosphaera hakonensis]